MSDERSYHNDMKCPITGKNCAKHKSFSVVNEMGGKAKSHLVCEDCIHQIQTVKILTPNDEKTCANCGLSLHDIIKGSRLGCAKCYDNFSETVPHIIASLQMGGEDIHHVGNFPRGFLMDRARETSREEFVEELSGEVSKACSDERYEDASRIKNLMGRFENEFPNERGRDARFSDELALFIFRYRNGDLE